MSEFKPSPLNGHVFIVTYGRSGSTLLQSLLNTIDGFQIRGENNNALFHMFKSWSAIKQANPLAGIRLKQQPTQADHPWYGGEKVDPDVLGANIARLFTQSVLRPDVGTAVSGFKEIRFTAHPHNFVAYLEFIDRYFHNSRFIFNTRNHSDVAKSGWWANRDPDEVSAQLTSIEELYRKYIEAHPDQCLSLHYDDYIEDRGKLAVLFDFLGEPLDMEVINKTMDKRLDHARGQK